MKAVVYTQYGSPDVLRLQELLIPVPRANEVLVKVQAASINAADWHLLTADIFLVRLMGGGILKPKKNGLGADLAGRVEAVGAAVTQFAPGDEVFGEISVNAGGTLAEYASVPERALVHKPAGLTFEQAAAAPLAATTALQGLRDSGGLRPGQKVLIQGASGGVGTFAVQLAKLMGAEVTAVCSPGNLEQARTLGADHGIDYTREDFTRTGRQYDLILAVNGYHPLADYRRALTPRGVFVMAGGSIRQIFETLLLGSWMSKKDGPKITVLSAKTSHDDLAYLKGLLESGQLKPVIDRSYPLSQAADAMRYLGSGHARGKIVITIPE